MWTGREEEQGVKILEKRLMGGEGGVFRNFYFGRGECHILLFVRERQFCGGGGGGVGGRRVVGGHIILKQKLKLHNTSKKSISGITNLIYFV